MENNRYYEHRAEIQKLAQEKNVDVGVACAMYRYKKAWAMAEKDTELTAFCAEFAMVCDAALATGGNPEDIENFWK